jgi:hypothetical protein
MSDSYNYYALLQESVNKLSKIITEEYYSNPVVTADAILSIAQSMQVSLYGADNAAIMFYQLADNLATLNLKEQKI